MNETSCAFPVIYQKNKTIRLIEGNILDDHGRRSMLVCSAFSGSYQTREGTLIGAISKDMGISVEELHDSRDTVYSAFDDEGTERCWVSCEIANVKFSRIACIELLDPNNENKDLAQIDLLKNTFYLFRTMLRKLNNDGIEFRRIVMTVPGIGNQGLEPTFVVPVLLAQLRAAARELEMLDEFVIYVKDHEKYETIKGILENGKPFAEKQVFISYSSKDSAEAEEIFLFLSKKGIQCWKAPEDIPQGSNYQVMIPKGLQDTYILLLIQSENSEKSRWCFKEVGTAIGSGHTIIPYKTSDYCSSDQFNFLMDGEQIFFAYTYEKEQRLDRLYSIIDGYIKKHEMIQ